MKRLCFLCAAVLALFLQAHEARAESPPGASKEGSSFLLSPSLTEVLHCITSGEDPESMLYKLKPGAGFFPYIGFADLQRTKILEPNEKMDMMGGVGYYAPNPNGGGFGFIFAVKDQVPAMMNEYRPDYTRMTPYISFSIQY